MAYIHAVCLIHFRHGVPVDCGLKARPRGYTAGVWRVRRAVAQAYRTCLSPSALTLPELDRTLGSQRTAIGTPGIGMDMESIKEERG